MKISSVGKKVGIAAGVAAAAGLTALAYVKGKKNLAEVDAFVNSNAVKKAGMAVGNGFKTMGQAAVAKAKTIPGYAKEFGTKALNTVKAGLEKAKGAFHKAETKVEEVAQAIVE